MSETDPTRWMTDEASIGRVAKDANERRLALTACLLQWISEDIGTIERVDSANPEWHGWILRRWKES